MNMEKAQKVIKNSMRRQMKEGNKMIREGEKKGFKKCDNDVI